MENRFGFKDLVLSALLVILIVIVLLAMKQYDRQWGQLHTINVQLRDQTRDLARIRRLLEQGITVSRSTAANPHGQSGSDPAAADTQPATAIPRASGPFARIKQAQAQPDYALGDHYLDVFGVVPDKLTPLLSSDVYASIIQNYVLQSLAARDSQTLQWLANLATGWRVSNNGLRIEFDIRRGVTFSDGEPLSADDVVFTFQWIMNEQVEAPRSRAYYEKIDRVEKLDDYRVAFIFKEPYFQSFELAAGMGVMPKHFYSRFTPTQFNRTTGLLMGTGPYRLLDPEAWRPEPGKPIELIRNERYWGEPGPFDKLVWRVIENESARLTTFRNGDIDAFYPTPEQYEGMAGDQEFLQKTQHFEFQRSNSGYTYIGWNQERQDKPTRFADKRVRQAMTLLTDRQRIIDEIYLGYGVVVSGPFNPLVSQSDKSVDPWPYDPQRARQLLREAGYEDRDQDGVLESPQGEPFEFQLNYPSNSATYERVVLFLKDTFARGGVIIKPKPLEWNVLLQRMDQRNFDAVSLGWSGSIESDPYQIFHSSQIKTAGDNYISYRNTELDPVIDEARRTIDQSKRMPLWHRVHQILHEDQPYTFLLTRKSLIFLDGRLSNVHRVKLGLNPQLEWYVPVGQRKWAH